MNGSVSLQESAASADGILGNLQARNDISLMWKNPPWPSKYQKREIGRYFKKHLNPEQQRGCGFSLFPESFHFFHNLLVFTTTGESFLYYSQHFTFFEGGGGSSEQADFSLGMLQSDASLPSCPCSSQSHRPEQRAHRDNSRGSWGWSRELQMSWGFLHFFKGLTYQVTPLCLPSIRNVVQCLASQTC